MENKTVEMVVKDLLLADNQKRKRLQVRPVPKSKLLETVLAVQ